MWWDQNEEYSQFTGDHSFIHRGYSRLTDALADGLDITLAQEVRVMILLCWRCCLKNMEVVLF